MCSSHFFKIMAVVWVMTWSPFSSAQNWPSKPIKWIIPYTPGGITDNATRMVVQKVQEQTGWNIVGCRLGGPCGA